MDISENPYFGCRRIKTSKGILLASMELPPMFSVGGWWLFEGDFSVLLWFKMEVLFFNLNLDQAEQFVSCQHTYWWPDNYGCSIFVFVFESMCSSRTIKVSC